MIKRNYNLKIDRLHPDKLKLMVLPVQQNLPSLIDLRNKMPPVYDQGDLGSCTANALCGLIGYDKPGFLGSRLFLYYNERFLENTVSQDSGATLYDGIQSLKNNGICPETDWPYIVKQFSVKPPTKCYQNALKEKALTVKNINTNDLVAMKTCLSSGFPFVIGIAVYESFETRQVAATGMVPMPKPKEQCLGGHAVCVVGYDDSKQSFVVRNSWGTNWGIKGYFYIPYTYLTNMNLASDAWTITLMN